MMDRTNVPARYRKLYDRAMAGRRPLHAIRAHCLMCIGWEPFEVEHCTAPGCPLYPYRFGVRPKSKGRQAECRSPKRRIQGRDEAGRGPGRPESKQEPVDAMGAGVAQLGPEPESARRTP